MEKSGKRETETRKRWETRSKLADRSERGWATVSAYVTDDLEDTPQDNLRISKAEKSAKKALDSQKGEMAG